MTTGDQIEVRTIRPNEHEEAGRVTALAYREFAPPEGSPDDGAGWHEYLAAIADVGGRIDRTVVLVAVDRRGTILGSVTIEEDATIGDDDEEVEPGASHIRMLGVDPAARGVGVGRALMQASIDRARRQRKRFMTLRTTQLMDAAQHLYGSMGFERDPERDIVFDDGFRLIAYRLALLASPPDPVPPRATP